MSFALASWPADLPKLPGMLPAKLFSARSRTCSELKFESLEGIFLENLLDRNLRILSSEKSSPSNSGMLPEKLLSPRSKVSKLDKFWNDDVPVSSLLLRRRD